MWNTSEASSGKILELKTEGDMHDNADTDFQANLGVMESKPIPAAPVPT